MLTDQERHDYKGQGTRSVGDDELRWRDPRGIVHACEEAEIMPGAVTHLQANDNQLG